MYVSIKMISFAKRNLGLLIAYSTLSCLIVWRKDRGYAGKNQALGGGVLIAVKGELIADARTEWCSSAEDQWVILTLQRKQPRVIYKMHICVIYIFTQRAGYSLSKQLTFFLTF